MFLGIIPSDVYHLTGDELRQGCLEGGLDTGGPLRLLRQRLSEYFKSSPMETWYVKMAQATTKTDMVDNIVGPVLQTVDIYSHLARVNGQAQVLVELLLRAALFSSEEPENILHFYIRLQEIHNLGPVADRNFVTHVLPLLTGSVLTCLGGLSQ
jgi:hypothetical protein